MLQVIGIGLFWRVDINAHPYSLQSHRTRRCRWKFTSKPFDLSILSVLKKPIHYTSASFAFRRWGELPWWKWWAILEFLNEDGTCQESVEVKIGVVLLDRNFFQEEIIRVRQAHIPSLSFAFYTKTEDVQGLLIAGLTWSMCFWNTRKTVQIWISKRCESS